MAQSLDRTRNFKAKFLSSGDASVFLQKFVGSFGHLDGRGYTCSGVEQKGSADGSVTVTVSFSPWHNPIPQNQSVGFEKKLLEADAEEIPNDQPE